jgi:ABC-type amino acid transport substrate-binding protein
MLDKWHDDGHSVADSLYRTLVNGALLKLQEKGVLEELKTKWWKPPGGTSCSEVCET